MKKWLMRGILILIIVMTIQTASAATVYEVTTMQEFIVATRTGVVPLSENVIIEIKDDLVIYGQEIAFIPKHVIINGNGNNITFHNKGIFINGSSVEFNNLNFRNSTGSNYDLIKIVNGTAKFESCIFENNIMYSNNVTITPKLIYAIGPQLGELKINNSTFVDNKGAVLVAEETISLMGLPKKGTVEIKNTNVKQVATEFAYIFAIANMKDVFIENVTVNDSQNRHPVFWIISTDFNMTGLTIENTTMWGNATVLIQRSNGTIQNSYFGNNTLSPQMTMRIEQSDVKILQNTFYYSFHSWQAGASNITAAFNTAYPGLQPDMRGNGNLPVISQEMYETYFGTNLPAQNGGYAKTIKLKDSEQNPAVEQITFEEYVAIMGTSPDDDRDATGSKRLRGERIDLGAVESTYKKSVIDKIIDNLFGGGDDENGEPGNPTKPSLIKFLFGEDSIFRKLGSLLYHIMNGYVKADIPLISEIHQKAIDLLRLQP